MVKTEAEVCEISEIHEDLLESVQANLPSDEVLFDLAELFKLFGDSTRVKILYVLFSEEVCVCDLAKVLHMTTSAISHQLALLKRSKLVKSRRVGKMIFYSLADNHVRTILGQGEEHLHELMAK